MDPDYCEKNCKELQEQNIKRITGYLEEGIKELRKVRS